MSKNMPLFVTVTDGSILNISIGMNTVLHAVMMQHDWPQDYVITQADQEAFAASLVKCLQLEDADGCTFIHRAIDTAAIDVLESAMPGITEIEGDYDGLSLEAELVRLRSEMSTDRKPWMARLHTLNPKFDTIDSLTLFSAGASYEGAHEQETRDAVEKVYEVWGVTHEEVCDELKARGCIT